MGFFGCFRFIFFLWGPSKQASKPSVRLLPLGALLLFALSCGGGATSNESNSSEEEQAEQTDQGPPLVMTGAVTAAYSSNPTLVQNIDSVSAYPIVDTDTGLAALTGRLTQKLDSDGSFRLTIPAKDRRFDWMVVLENSRGGRLDKMLGFVVLRQNDLGQLEEYRLDKLLRIPVSELQPDQSLIEFGNLVALRGSQEAQASRTLEDLAPLFKISEEALIEMAATDDTLKGIENFLANWSSPGAETVKTGEAVLKIRPVSSFAWRGALDKAMDSYFDPSFFRLGGYGIGVVVNSVDLINLSQACAKKSEADYRSLAIVPPLSVTKEDGKRISPQEPFKNEGLSGAGPLASGKYGCSLGTLPLTLESSALQGAPIEVDFGSITGLAPAGSWGVRVNDATLGEIDFRSLSPVDNEGRPSIYVPIPRLSTQNDGSLTELTVLWQYYGRKSTKFHEVLDDTWFGKRAKNVTFVFRNSDGSKESKILAGNDSGVTLDEGRHRIVLANALGIWSRADRDIPTDRVGLDQLIISYEWGGQKMQFVFRMPPPPETTE